MNVTMRYLVDGGDNYRWGFTYTDERGKRHRHFFPKHMKGLDGPEQRAYVTRVIDEGRARSDAEVRMRRGGLTVIEGGGARR